MKNFLSQEKQYCEGYFANSKSNNYFLGVCLTTAKQKKKFSHEGSTLLDEINAYDIAEITGPNIGQINMIKVSSFCGPRGKIWGYDICQEGKKPYIINNKGFRNIPVFDITGLEKAFTKLMGTIDKPRFPFLPGSHVPCAVKYITKPSKGIIYASQAIGIPEQRDRHACILMEDVGEIPLHTNNIKKYSEDIVNNMINSVLEIARNQKIQIKEVFIGLKDIFIDEDEVGCAMIASPYFLLANNAMPQNDSLEKLNITNWEESISNYFLHHNV